jgi:glycosyltransferase involved in cell wall biosynthesis
MRYALVTPTICRPSLVRLCESIDRQRQRDWEHLLVVDLPQEKKMTESQRKILNSIPRRPNRSIFYCDRNHHNYGHTCRHQAWERVKAEYIFYIDDDDYLTDGAVLETLDSVTEAWAVFPVLRHGQEFFSLPPGNTSTGTGMFIHRKEIGRWPDSNAYDADGVFVDELVKNYSYQVVKSRPLVALPTSSCGVSDAETFSGRLRAKGARYWLYFWKRLLPARKKTPSGHRSAPYRSAPSKEERS